MYAKIMLAFALLIFALFTGIMVQYQVVFAQDDNSTQPVAIAEDGNSTKPVTLEDECAKKEESDFDALMCRAILELQIKVTDIEAKMTEKQVVKEEPPKEEPSKEVTKEVAEDKTPVSEMSNSPLKQLISGVDPSEITCKTGQMLVFKASNWRPSCIDTSTFDILVIRGWISTHEPSSDDLMNMKDEYVTAHPQEETGVETTEETVEETAQETGTGTSQETGNEIVDLQEAPQINGTSPDNSTGIDNMEGQTQQQSHTVQLREEVEMGVQ